MSNDFILRAMPLIAGGVEVTKKSFDGMRGFRKAGALDYMEGLAKMTKYFAWLQEGIAGDFLVEYWESPLAWEEIAANAKEADSPHLRWAREQIDLMTGGKADAVLDLTSELLSDWPEKGGKTGLALPAAFALPILPGKTALLKETIAEFNQGKSNADAQAHLRRLQTIRWISTLQRMSGKEYYVQYLELEKDLPATARILSQSDNAYAKRMEEKFKEFSGVDFRAGWPKSTLLAELKDFKG